MSFRNDCERIMTYKEYRTWGEEESCEVLNGAILTLSMFDKFEHQDILNKLTNEFTSYLKGKIPKVFPHTNVYLFEDCNQEQLDEDASDWLTPDLMVICEPKNIKRDVIVGAPDLAIEIMSPSTVKLDRQIKYQAYEKAGVKEYWIVDTANQGVMVYSLNNNSYSFPQVYDRKDAIPVQVLEGFTIKLANIFPEMDY